MKTIEMDRYAKYKSEIKELQKENEELRSLNAELERKLADLHGEYMLLRYQLKGLPSPSEFTRMRQELLELKKKIYEKGWRELA
jgi:hypothetical protein